jgi:hypothetical protein
MQKLNDLSKIEISRNADCHQFMASVSHDHGLLNASQWLVAECMRERAAEFKYLARRGKTGNGSNLVQSHATK